MINNEEDKKIWDCLVNFDFQTSTDIPDLRLKLFKSIVEKIGKCSQCTAYIPETSYCSILKTFTGPLERCSDFDPVEIETKAAFDIMTEEFQEQEKVKMNEPHILKYKRNKKKEMELGGEF